MPSESKITKTSRWSLAKRILEVDDLARRDHSYLTAEDKCYFYGEYTAREGHAYSETNQLIVNFKKSVDKRGRPEWYYKEKAITEAASIFRAAFKPGVFQQITLVPIPPSKAKTHPLYDDRMLRMLQAMCAGYQSDIRELVLQTDSMDASHTTDNRPPPDQLAAHYRIDETVSNPAPKTIALFDDVLTTGSHFKAVKQVLQTRFPGVPVVGFFIARRVPKSIDFDAFDLDGPV